MSESLRDHQLRAGRVCLAPEVDEEDLKALGAPQRWSIYRTMVRTRLSKVCAAAMPRVRKSLGAKAFDASIESWLAEAPPRTRYFRELPQAFFDFAFAHERLLRPPWVADLARFELALWNIKAVDDRDLPTVSDFRFEGVPHFSPAMALLDVEFAVDKQAGEDGSYAKGATTLMIYRTRDFRGRCLRLNGLAAALVRSLVDASSQGNSVTHAVQAAAQKQGVAIDQKLVDGLSALLEKLLTRGILRGCLTEVPLEEHSGASHPPTTGNAQTPADPTNTSDAMQKEELE